MGRELGCEESYCNEMPNHTSKIYAWESELRENNGGLENNQAMVNQCQKLLLSLNTHEKGLKFKF